VQNSIDRPSPWWYRQRGSVIGAVYGLGFVLGYLSLDGSAPKPAYIVAGLRLAGAGGPSILVWAAIVSALIAWVWRASGTAFLRRDVVFASDVQHDRLIVAGPFRYVRNPLYVGNMFLALAAAIMAPPLGFAIILIGNAVIVAFLAAEESRELARRYGSAYDAFRAAVPAFFPRLTPASVPGSVSAAPDWPAAFLGEGFCAALAIALVPIALDGSAGLPAFWIIGTATIVIFVTSGWLASRTRR
jgi:protein-S-isoprenylcysteine O-methyltransferase Ste14